MNASESLGNVFLLCLLCLSLYKELLYWLVLIEIKHGEKTKHQYSGIENTQSVGYKSWYTIANHERSNRPMYIYNLSRSISNVQL